MNRTIFAPVMILATLGVAACSDNSPTDIPTPSFAAIGGQTFTENFNKGASSHLEATGPAATYGTGAAVFGDWDDRGYLRTIGSYKDTNVRADVIVTVPGDVSSTGIAFIGFGSGEPGSFYTEPNGGPSIYARILPNDFWGPAIQLTDATDGVEELEKTEGVGGTGTHRVRATWNAATSTFTFAIHQHYVAGAEFVATATISRTIDASLIDAANARVFIGGAGNVTFDDLKVVVSNGSMQ